MSCDAEKQRSTPCDSLLLENRTIDTVYSPDIVYSHLTPSPYVEIGLVTSGNGIHRIISALEQRKFIKRAPNRARAIEVLTMPAEKYVAPVKVMGKNKTKGC